MFIKKNILILFGSPNKDGYTGKMVEYFKNGIDKYNIFEFNAYNEKINPCIGCNICKDNGECFLDDFKRLEYFFKILNPEILIIASPIYNFGFPAPLKAILDRLQPYYYNSKFNCSERKAILFLSSGRELYYKNEIIKRLNIILKSLNFKIKFSCICEKTDFDKKDKNIKVKHCIDIIKYNLDLTK